MILYKSLSSSVLSKFLVFVFIISFFISPLAPVFAQEVAAEVAPVVEQSSNVAESVETADISIGQNTVEQPSLLVGETAKEGEVISENNLDKEKEIKNPITEEPEMMTMSSPGDPPFNPENLTAGLTEDKKGLIETDETNGALNYSFPIVVPPGRNGMQPDLKLNYNNQQANNYSNIIGYGWNINIPYINRINKLGTDKLYTNNYFYSSLSGELVLVSGNTYAPKVENGDFLKYTYDGTSWVVTDKKGTTYKFGQSSSSRQDDSTGTKAAKWMLDDLRDTNNNYIKYAYYKDGGQIYPDNIKYTGNDTTDGIFEVSFSRQSRNDVIKSYAVGFLVTTNYRINEIQTKVNNTWVKKYTLGYTTGDNGNRSLLSSITESGQDESSNTTTLPAVSFTYYTSTPGWTLNTSTYTAPTLFGNGYQSMLDVNGDALPDIVESYNTATNPIKNTYLNNGNGTWSVNSGLQPPILFKENEIRGGAYQNEWDQGVRMGDVNGDLLPDIIKSEDNTNNKGGYDAYINTDGSSWTQNSAWHPTVTFNGDETISTWGAHFIDLNGDGLSDITRDQGTSETQISSGTAFGTSTQDWDSSIELNGPNMQFVDVNGDDLPDIIYTVWIDNGNTRVAKVYLNKGDGTWAQDDSFLPSVDIVYQSNLDSGIRFFDVNNDGLVDAVSQYNSLGGGNHGTYLNTGTSWVYSSSWEVPSSEINFNNSPYISITDLNADGSLDFFTTQNSSPTVTKAFLNNTTVPTDTLKKVTFSQGGNTEITYKKSSKYVDGSNNLLNPDLPIALDTVYQIVTSDNNGITSTDTFSYEGGLYYYNTVTDKKLTGFAKVTKTNSAGNKTINYFHQGNSTSSSQGEYDDHISKARKIYRTEITDSSGNIYQKIINRWDKYNQGTGRDFVKLVRSTALTYDGDNDHKDTSEEYTYDNSYGNLTSKITWGEVNASDDGSFTDTGTDKATESISYTSNTTDYIVGLPYQDTVVDQSSNKVRESKTYYDTQSLGNVTDGNITKIEKWKSGTTYVNTQKAYNTTYGIPTSFTDERGKVTSYTYDSYYLYPTTITDPLSNETDYTYDYSSGKVKQITDVNGFVYQKTYDGLDRTLTEKIPDFASPYSAVTKTAYSYIDTSGATSISKIDYLDSTNTVSSYKYFDGLGRSIQDRTETETGYAVKDYLYNNIGLLDKESLPYDSSGTSKTTPTTTTALYTTYTYDVMQRPSTVVNAVGTTSYAYDDWKTTVTDPRSKVKSYYKDAYDNLVQVDEVNNSSTYTTSYEWNLNKNLTKITDALSNVRNFTYDGLNRRLTAEDLHASGDSTFGTWTYTYDNAGNMTQSVSPESKTVDYTYDDLNRVLTENYTGATGTEISYGYDSCTNGIGKLCSVTMTNGSNTSYTYDSNGNTTSEAKTINSNSYTTSYTYDRLGNKLIITYPDNAEVKYTYNTAGQLEKIERKESGGSYTDVVTNFNYGPHGKMILQENANGTQTENTYDETKNYLLSRILTVLPPEEMSMMQRSSSIDILSSVDTSNNVVNNKEFLMTNGVYSKMGTTPKGEDIIKAKIFTRDVNYLDSKINKLKKIDSTPIDSGDYWAITDAPYNAKIKKQTNNTFLFFSNGSNDINFSLSKNSKLEIVGQTVLENDLNKIVYPNALGNNIDLQIKTGPTFVRKEIVVKNKEALINIIKNKEFYEIPFKIGFDSKLILTDSKGKILTSKTSLTTSEEVTLTGNNGTKTYIWAPIVKGNTGGALSINIRYELKPDGIYMTKLLPVEWLQKAQYPVTTDAVVSYQTNSSGDGDIFASGGNWDTVRSASSGYAHSSDESSYASVQWWGWMYDKEFYRMALPIDTSGIPDDATISSASLKVYVWSTYDGEDDGNDFIRLVQNTTASSTALANDDYDQIGSLSNPTAGATDKDLTDMQNNGFYSFDLNSTGLGWINKTGYTKLGLREGHDVVNDPFTWGRGSGIRIYTSNYYNSNLRPYLEITYTIPNQSPTAPTSLETEGSTNPIDVLDTTPEFSAIYNDPNPTDIATHYKIQVSTSTDFTSPLWDSGKQALSSSLNQGQESEAISYGGTAFDLDGSTYYWHIKFWDDENAEGAWSTTTASFTMYDNTTFVIQDLNFTYDNNGNITQIIDASETDSSKTVTYSYDDLNRMTQAVATNVASGQSTYTQNFTYNAIGNITSGPVGSYTYAGTGYANPHAATSINSVTNTYDNNGNVLTDGTLTNTWNYKDQLATSTNGTFTRTYKYDEGGNRVYSSDGTVVTVYPNKYYDYDGTKKTKSIYAGGQLVATIETVGAVVTPYYDHTDHLGSVAVVSDSSGGQSELLDYMPYGSQRISSGSYTGQRQYIGQIYDPDSALNYLQARYMNSLQGRFISEDPMFWSLPDSYLFDPQQQNSYSYARGNPLINSDPSGKSIINYVPYNNSDGYYSYGSIQGTYYGVPIYSNGNNRNGQYQCPGFVKNFSQAQFGANLSGLGNGGQYSEQSRYDSKMTNQAGSFTVYQNGGSQLPKENDIMSWTSSVGGYGHVGIVVQVYFDSEKGSGTLLTAEQNQSARGGIFSQNITSATVNGVTNYTVQPKNATSTNIPAAFARYNNPSPENRSSNSAGGIISKMMNLFR